MNAIHETSDNAIYDAEQLPEISPAMLERLERSVAGGTTWCQATWAQGCD